MRFVLLLAGLAATLSFVPKSVLADPAGDLEECKFVGAVSKADQSILACDRVIKDKKITGPSRAAAFGYRCGWWWFKHEPQLALSDCNESIRLDSGSASSYLNRGNAYATTGDSAHALLDFNEAIRLDPNSAWAYNSRGDLYKNGGDFERALLDFDQSIKLDPSYALAYFNRGYVFRVKGDFERALPDLNEAIRLDAGNALWYFNRGSLLYLMGENSRAIDDFNNSIRLDSTYALAYFNRGVAYFVVGGHLADAEADFRKANELNPKDAYAMLWLHLAERRNNAPSRLAEAAKELDKTAWPAPIVRMFLGELSFAQTLAAANDTDPKRKREHLCEVNFYGGELALTNENKKDAPRLLQLSASDCPRGFVELNASIVELILNHT
jgi:lipoprotein NlpI